MDRVSSAKNIQGKKGWEGLGWSVKYSDHDLPSNWFRENGLLAAGTLVMDLNIYLPEARAIIDHQVVIVEKFFWKIVLTQHHHYSDGPILLLKKLSTIRYWKSFLWSGVRLSVVRCLIRTKWSLGRRTPLYNKIHQNIGIGSYDSVIFWFLSV